MNRKVLPISVLFFLSGTLVSAKSFLPKSFENVFIWLFERFPQQVRSQQVLAIAFVKFLLWILVFAMMYSALQKVFRSEGRMAGVISTIIAFISVALMPKSVVLLIFELYSGIVAVLLPFLGVALVWYFSRKVFGHGKMSGLTSGLVMLLSALLMFFMASALEMASGGFVSENFPQWIRTSAVILIIVGLINFMEGTRHGRESGDGEKNKTKKLRKIKNEERLTMRDGWEDNEEGKLIERITAWMDWHEQWALQQLAELHKVIKLLSKGSLTAEEHEKTIHDIDRIRESDKAKTTKKKVWDGFVKRLGKLIGDEIDHLKNGEKFLEKIIEITKEKKLHGDGDLDAEAESRLKGVFVEKHRKFSQKIADIRNYEILLQGVLQKELEFESMLERAKELIGQDNLEDGGSAINSAIGLKQQLLGAYRVIRDRGNHIREEILQELDIVSQESKLEEYIRKVIAEQA